MEIVSEEFAEFFLRDFLNFYFPSGGIYRLPYKNNAGGYYIPSVDSEGYLNWKATKPNMPEVERVNITNKVKVWGAADGLVCPSTSPYDFDFTQIPENETVEVDLGLELDKFDISRFEGRNVGAALIVVDEETKFNYTFNFAQFAGMFVMGFQGDGDSLHYFKKGDTYVNFTADSEGWYSGEFNEPETVHKATSADIARFSGYLKKAKIVDFGSIQLKSLKEEMGLEVENVLDEIINNLICFYLPTGYYKMPRNTEAKSSGGLDLEITPEDEGKFLMIQGGAVAKVTIEEVLNVLHK
ncbi:MAG: hypothetical protein E7536_03000 [Ruminococcaceae bacterium]|nr:hypothetical protein [Oscillospiraceae bacterium]